ncbi:lysophospholipid acyltransferase family protein [bacterium]|nr:lysophospholipid acyltransferase family protein [bacterium]MBU1957808.1 lysophospholipid acyltransferase family protein [bacterium]
MKLLWFSYRKKYHFIDAPIEEQCMAVTWHAELFVSPQVYRKLRKKQATSAIISQHYDGDLIAKTLSFFDITPLRGSSKRGAKSVLMNAIKVMKEGDSVMVTPDGPRGPRYSMSDGAIALALRFNLPLMVVNYKPNSYWQLNSWDRFVIPKPFSSLDIYHQIVKIDDMEKEEAKIYLQEHMKRYALA